MIPLPPKSCWTVGTSRNLDQTKRLPELSAGGGSPDIRIEVYSGLGNLGTRPGMDGNIHGRLTSLLSSHGFFGVGMAAIIRLPRVMHVQSLPRRNGRQHQH